MPGRTRSQNTSSKKVVGTNAATGTKMKRTKPVWLERMFYDKSKMPQRLTAIAYRYNPMTGETFYGASNYCRCPTDTHSTLRELKMGLRSTAEARLAKNPVHITDLKTVSTPQLHIKLRKMLYTHGVSASSEEAIRQRLKAN